MTAEQKKTILEAVKKAKVRIDALEKELSEEKAKTAALERDLTEERLTVKSWAMMMGWANVPPREVLERNLNVLKARALESGPTRKALEEIEKWRKVICTSDVYANAANSLSGQLLWLEQKLNTVLSAPEFTPDPAYALLTALETTTDGKHKLGLIWSALDAVLDKAAAAAKKHSLKHKIEEMTAARDCCEQVAADILALKERQ